MKCFMLMMLLAVVSGAHAGERVGNGGNAVVCYTDSTKQKVVSVEMFDHWEMSRVYKNQYTLNFLNSSLSIEEIMTDIITRIAKFDIYRAKQYQAIALQILSDIPQIMNNSDLPVIEDDHPNFTPKAPCYKEQFAVQIKDPSPNQNRFEISKRLWESPYTTNQDRAGLILHEVFYRDFIENGATDSDDTRMFNFLVSSTFFNNLGVSQYKNLLQQTGLPNMLVEQVEVEFGSQKVIMQLDPRSITKEGNTISGWLMNIVTLKSDYVSGTIDYLRDSPYGSPEQRAIGYSRVILTEKPKSQTYILSEIYQDQNYRILYNLDFIYNGSVVSISPWRYDWSFKFNNAGLPMQGRIEKGSIKVQVNGQEVQCGIGPFAFFSNGNLKGCFTQSKINIRGVQVNASYVRFNEIGELLNIGLKEDTLITHSTCTSPILFKGGSFINLLPNGKLDPSKKTVEYFYNSIIKEGTLANPPSHSYSGKIYESSFKDTEFVGCKMKAKVNVQIDSKNEMMLTLPYQNLDISKYHNIFCKAEGFEGNWVRTSNTIQVREMFTKVYDLLTLKSKDAPIGSNFKQITGNCIKNVEINL